MSSLLPQHAGRYHQTTQQHHTVYDVAAAVFATVEETKLHRNLFDVRVKIGPTTSAAHGATVRALCFGRALAQSRLRSMYIFVLLCSLRMCLCICLDSTEWDIYYPRRVHNQNRKIEP